MRLYDQRTNGMMILILLGCTSRWLGVRLDVSVKQEDDQWDADGDEWNADGDEWDADGEEVDIESDELRVVEEDLTNWDNPDDD